MTAIKFGTSGWRAVMADEFTFANVRRTVNAIAAHLKPRIADGPVIVGYDTRFLSPEFARETAAILSRQGFQVLFSDDFIPTPVVSFQILHHRAIGGINFTASHNPAEYNGIKFNGPDGAPASPEVTHEIEDLANQAPAEVEAGSFASTLAQGTPAHVRTFDARPAYLAALKKTIDVSTLRKAKLRVGVDVLYGTGRGYLDTFFAQSGCKPVVLHDWRDVTFGGHPPEPAEVQLQELVGRMRQDKLIAGFGTDGDADRFGILDSDGTLLTPNEILPIVLQHLVKTRGWKGLVVRSVMTSGFIDAVARHYGLPVKETPVGFKYIAEAMKDGGGLPAGRQGFLMGGEESGGLTIQGHVPEKDGILACLLMAEVRAVQKKPFRQILKELWREVGPYLSDRVNVHLTDAAMQDVRRRMETLTPNTMDGLAVKKIVRIDGFKFIFQDDSWLGVRLSGTEPVVRLYLQAASEKKLRQLKKIGTQLITQGA